MGDFWTLAGIDGDRTALVVPGSAPVTYQSLSAAADHWMTKLRDVAGQDIPLVALEFATSPDAIAAYLGALRAGFPMLIVEPNKLAAESHMTRTWNPDVLVTAGPNGPTLAERPGWRDDVKLFPPPNADLRVLLSTSGSTGEPKLVRLSARNISANAHSIAKYLRIEPSDRAATTLPLFYSYGLSVLNSYLAAGASLALITQPVTDAEFWKAARAANVTSIALVPHQFDLLRGIDFNGTELPSLRYITQAGGKLHPGAVRYFWDLGRSGGWQLFIMYGQTEAAPRISYVPPGALPEAADTIGCAIPGGRLWIAAEDGSEILDPGRAGELVYEGPNVMMGYAITRLDLAADAELSDLRTGDVAERTGAGYFRIVGRLKRFVKLYGLRLSLDQIEASLLAGGITAHAVAPNDRLVVLCRDAVDVQAARQTVADDYGIPLSDVYADWLEELPLLPSGKVDDQALRRVADVVVQRARDAQRVATDQASVAEVMRWATRQTHVRTSDSFVSLGGDSLSYLQVQIVLDDRLGAAPRGWERMTIAQLESLVANAGETTRMPRTRVSLGVDVVLRLLAISMIVMQHATTFPVYGGAWILLAVMGFSAARFQVQLIAQGRPLKILARMLYPIVPLYYVLLLIYAMLRDPVPLRYWLLIGNYEPWTGGSLLVVYWFVSVYAQIVVVLAIVSSVGPARRLVTNDPWRAGMLAVTGILAILTTLVLIQTLHRDLPYLPQRGLPECLSMFTLGWLLQRMNGVRQTLITVALTATVIVMLAILDMTPQVLAAALGALALLAFRLEIEVSRSWARILNQLASTTLYVYLFHQIIIYFLSRFQLAETATAVISLVLSFAVAAGAKRAFDSVDHMMVRLRAPSRSKNTTTDEVPL